ncbi:MAG: hypothetical protein ACYDAD_15770, partial [Acidimicrobiales bacterium]
VAGSGGVNPLGQVPFSGFAASGSSTGASSGGIPNPVLTSAAPVPGSNNLIAYTFNQNLSTTATSVGAFGYDDSTGNEFTCGAGGGGCTANTAGSTVTVAFPTTVVPSPTAGARFFVHGVGTPAPNVGPGVFSSVTFAGNAETAAGAATTGRPNLVSVARTSVPNQFLFTVDAASTVGTPNNFLIYSLNGGTPAAGSVVNAQSNTQFLVGFPTTGPGAVTTSNTGGFTYGAMSETNVGSGAVLGNGPGNLSSNTVGGAAIGSGNATLGNYQGPILVSASGQIATLQVTYVFDRAIAAGSVVPGDFFVIGPGGATQATGTASIVNSGSNSVTVTFGGQSVAGIAGAGVIGCFGPNPAPPGCAGAGTQAGVAGGALPATPPATDTQVPATAVAPADVTASAS